MSSDAGLLPSITFNTRAIPPLVGRATIPLHLCTRYLRSHYFLGCFLLFVFVTDNSGCECLHMLGTLTKFNAGKIYLRYLHKNHFPCHCYHCPFLKTIMWPCCPLVVVLLIVVGICHCASILIQLQPKVCSPLSSCSPNPHHSIIDNNICCCLLYIFCT